MTRTAGARKTEIYSKQDQSPIQLTTCKNCSYHYAPL